MDKNEIRAEQLVAFHSFLESKDLINDWKSSVIEVRFGDKVISDAVKIKTIYDYECDLSIKIEDLIACAFIWDDGASGHLVWKGLDDEWIDKCKSEGWID